MSLEQIINEDFYKNIFRLLNSPKPEASAELKKICDDLTAMYEARGITEYWPPIPGDSTPTGEGTPGSADYTPVSTRKFEKPIAPVRKDSLAVDRLSPHLSVLRSSSPRLLSASAELGPSPAAPRASTSADDVAEGDSATGNNSTDNGDSVAISGVVGSETATQKSSVDAEPSGDDRQPLKKDDASRRPRSEAITSAVEGEPPEKRPKVMPVEMAPPPVSQPVAKTAAKVELNTTGDELDSLACVVCKTFDLVSAGNLMVECHECHNMYHQKCHQPNVPSSQINDPRMLWYCNTCDKKSQKKLEPSPATSKPSPISATAVRRNTAASSRDEKRPPVVDKSDLFKRSSTMETKDKQMPLSTASKPVMKADLLSKAATFLEMHKKKAVAPPPQKTIGTAGSTNPFAMALSTAANSTGSAKLATPTTTSGGLSKLASTVQQQNPFANSLKSSAPSGSTNVSPTSSSAIGIGAKQLQTSSSQMQAAEKRLQQMKKKAAMKGSYKI